MLHLVTPGLSNSPGVFLLYHIIVSLFSHTVHMNNLLSHPYCLVTVFLDISAVSYGRLIIKLHLYEKA